MVSVSARLGPEWRWKLAVGGWLVGVREGD
jgi:hypothetical protein